MKKTIFIVFIALIIGCKTTKLDPTTGDRNPTWNTNHIRKIHEKQGGFWAAGKWIKFPGVTYKQITTRN